MKYFKSFWYSRESARKGTKGSMIARFTILVRQTLSRPVLHSFEVHGHIPMDKYNMERTRKGLRTDERIALFTEPCGRRIAKKRLIETFHTCGFPASQTQQ